MRAIGVRALAATAFNVLVGGGIFVLPAAVAAGLGTAAPLAYIVCAIAMGLIVLCLAEAGSRVALTGGTYAYVEVALGRYAGFVSGLLLWLPSSFGQAAVASAFAGTLAFLVPALDGALARALVLAALMGFLAFVNYRGVRQAARFVEVVTVAKLLPLLLLLVAGTIVLARSPVLDALVMPNEWPTAAAVGSTAVTLFFAYAGLEAALTPSGEVREPSRTVPRALAIAMTTVTLLYIAIQLVVQGLLGPEQLASERDAPLAAAARVALGPVGSTIIAVGAAISMFGHGSGMMLAMPRAVYAFARDGILPRALASVHPRYHTPHIAIVAHAIVIWVLAASTGFEQLARLATVSVLLLYLLCCVSAWVLRRKDVRGEGAPFTAPGGALVPILACVVIVWLLTSASAAEFGIVGAVLVVTSLLWLITRRSVHVSSR